MTDTPELDPIAIRKSLAIHRAAGHPWQEAWADAAGPPPTDDGELWRFMENHFRAAYYDTPSSLGRCRVPERDTHEGERVAVGSTAKQVATCRSGDGCDRPATCGRFAPRWCDFHGAELERLAATMGTVRWNGVPIAGTAGVEKEAA